MEKTGFMVVTKGYGITGVKLDLNLLQCKELGNLSVAIDAAYKLDTPERGDVLADVIERMTPFLALFKDFSVAAPEKLWDNSNNE